MISPCQDHPACLHIVAGRVSGRFLLNVKFNALAADKPTLYSVAQVSRNFHALVMPFLMECYLSTSESGYATLLPQKKIDAVLHLQNWLVETAEDMPATDIAKA
jgi:hypothetical protein